MNLSKIIYPAEASNANTEEFNNLLAEVYSKPCQTTKMGTKIAKTINIWKPLAILMEKAPT